jgi:nucleotide-binding universal stress UspA family protein
METGTLEKILVAFDGSEESKKALSYAITFARVFNSLITIVYVAGETVIGPLVSPSAASQAGEFQASLLPLPENIRDLMTKEALDILSQTKEDVEKIWHKLDFAVVSGDPSSEIVKEAKKGYDLVIVGHRGLHSSLFSLGNVAEKVVKNAPCSVLVIK